MHNFIMKVTPPIMLNRLYLKYGELLTNWDLVTFLSINRNPIIDDHLYINRIAKIPTVNIVHQDIYTGTGFNPTWHTLMDNIAHIDKNSLDKVGKTVLAVIYSE